MRVIAGTARGIVLKAPPGRFVRPTRDSVKEAFFNILGPWIEGRRILDLYSGSGSLGIEALSRGAASVLFVESDIRSIRCIQDNLVSAHLAESAEIERGDALRFLSQVASGSRKGGFHGVFADPPFEFSEGPGLKELVDLFNSENLWGHGELVGIIEVESGKGSESFLDKLPGPPQFRNYGRNLLAISRWEKIPDR